MASEWRVDVDSEGELGDVVATNPAYPDEIMVLAEFTDPADAARCVEAVNALPGLRSEVARLKAALAAAEAELTRACANHPATADALLAAEARAAKAEAPAASPAPVTRGEGEPLQEGRVSKGGQNATYQITERPPDPPPMTPRCRRCGLAAGSAVHHAQVNGHAFEGSPR